MGTLKPSFVFLFLLGLLCVANSSPFNLFGKSDDAKPAEDDKDVKEVAATTTTTTTTPTSSCSGLGSFFHLCDKTEPTEPPKKAKRDVSEEDDSDESDEEEGAKKEAATASNFEGEIAKRQVGDPEAPVLGEVPPVLEEAMKTPQTEGDGEEAQKKRRQLDESGDEKDGEDEEETQKKRRQVDESGDEDGQDKGDMEEASRKRRDCRDRDGDYEKDCRKKREYVPSCFSPDCVRNDQTTTAP